MIKGIIFDMDGVIIDSEPLYIDYDYKFFNNLGANISKEDLLTFVGCPARVIISEIIKKYNITSIPYEKILRLHSAGYELILTQNHKLTLCEGVIDWLQYFKDNNYPIAIASSTINSKIGIVLERFNLKEFFNVYVGGDEIENGKPNPDIFIKAAQMLNLKPRECMVIEDSTNGVKASKAAGCYTVGYLNNGENTQDLSKADIVFDKFGKEKISMLEKVIASQN